MMRDTFFSMPRFVNLCRKDMVENWRANVLRMVLMYGVMAIVMIWNGYLNYYRELYREIDPAWDFVLSLLIFGLFGFGSLSASFTMEKMKSKTSRLSTLMTPATPFEKFFSRWFISTVVFLVVFLIAYKLADYTRVLVYTLKYPEIKSIATVSLSHLVQPAEGTGGMVNGYYLFPSMEILILVIALYFFTQSLFVLGSSVWPKNAFLKTFAAGIVIIIIYVLVASGLGNLLFDKGKYYSFGHISEDMTTDVVSALAIIMTLVNWIIAYFRFKESEIINRM